MADRNPDERNPEGLNREDPNREGPNREGNDWIDDTKAEISGMAKQGMAHPSTKPVLTGAAVGALAGALLPVLTLPIGIVAGAAFVLYKRIRR